MRTSEKPKPLNKYFQSKLAVIEINDGETQEEAWRRYLSTNPRHANAQVIIFHYPAKVALH